MNPSFPRTLLLNPALAMLMLFAAAGASVAPAAGQRGTAQRRPNVLLILADDFGYECVGANGSASYQTPNLDRLAEGGARFTHCYAAPLCTPTRVMLMTGRYNPRNYTRFGSLAQGEQTFANTLKSAGYRTAVAGKWQLDGARGQKPAQAGFDEYCLWNIGHAGESIGGDRYADPNLLVYDRTKGRPEVRKVLGGYCDDVCADYLTEFMERSVREKQPFLAYFPMILTHGPFQPTPHSPEWKVGNRKQNDKRFFKDMVEYLDHVVGRVVKKLEALGVRDNTLILFTGDNGTGGGHVTRMKDGTQITGGKWELTDAGTHAPMITNWPGVIPPGRVVTDLVDLSDVLPTIADATGAPLPRPPGDGVLDGRSFLPWMKGQLPDGARRPREWVLIDFRYNGGKQEERGVYDGRFARDQRWKLYGFAADGRKLVRSGELYDLRSDPNETRPVSPGNADGDAARLRLQAALSSVPAQP